MSSYFPRGEHSASMMGLPEHMNLQTEGKIIAQDEANRTKSLLSGTIIAPVRGNFEFAQYAIFSRTWSPHDLETWHVASVTQTLYKFYR